MPLQVSVRVKAILLAFWAWPAAADVSVDAVWQLLKADANGLGLSLEAAVERREGRDLHLAGVLIGPAIASETGWPRALIGEIVLRDAGDRVDLVLPQKIVIEVADQANVTLRQDGLTVTVSEIEGGFRTAFSGRSLRISNDTEGVLDMPDGGVETAFFSVSAVFDAPTGEYHVADGPVVSRELDLRAGALRIGMNSIDPWLGENFKADFDLTDLDLTGRLAVAGATAAAAADPGAMLGGSLELRAARVVESDRTIATEPAMVFDSALDGGPFTAEMGLEFPLSLLQVEPFREDFLVVALESGARAYFVARGGETVASGSQTGTFPNFSVTSLSTESELEFRFGPDDLTLRFSDGPGQFLVRLTDTAFPEMRIGYEGLRLEGLMPALALDEAEPFGFGLWLTGFVFNDEIWDFFDRRKALSRDPASLILDTSGLMTFDLARTLSGNAMEVEADFEGLVERLDLNEVLLAFGGARLAGGGSFEFDPEVVYLDGGPIPVGKLTLGLDGAQVLLAALERTGFIPAADLESVNTWLNEYWPDPYSTDRRSGVLEVRPDGDVHLNGRSLE